MANSVTHLPHVKNVAAGNNMYDPVHGAVFEVVFSLPPKLREAFDEEYVELLTQQVTDIDGLDILQKTVQAGSQKFFGADASFLNPSLDTTYAELTINLNLNLRSVTDNYVLKVFKAWEKLGYDLSDGTRTLMADYMSDGLRVNEANRDGTIWRTYNFHRVLLDGVTGLNTLNYTDNEARKLSCHFRADYWDEDLG